MRNRNSMVTFSYSLSTLHEEKIIACKIQILRIQGRS